MDPQNNQETQDYYCIAGRDECLRVQQRIHALEISEARYQNLFEAVSDALISFNPEARITRSNSACTAVFGWPAASLIGRSLADLFVVPSRLSSAFQQALGGQSERFEFNFQRLERPQTLEMHLTPIHDGLEISGVLLAARNLTAKKQRDQERCQLYDKLQISHKALEEKALALEESQRRLQQAMTEQEKTNAELRELGRLKSDFIGVASHELRTPMTFLRGSLEYLVENLPARMTEDEKGLLDYAMQGAQRLSAIVENMLDIVRLEAEGFRPQKVKASVFQLLESLVKELEWIIHERGLTLKLAPENAWPDLLIDPDMVRRAFEDIIENAVKYTETGGLVEVSGRVRSHASLLVDIAEIHPFWPEFPESLSWDGDFYEIVICDNGIGIPRQELSHVFERFYTVGKLEEHSSGMKFRGEGAGLGLALAKRIARCHDGLIWAYSPGSIEETGRAKPGSRFHLLFPLEPTSSAEEIPVVEEYRKRILLIDDEPAIRRFVEVLLRNEYDLELAADGLEGLEKARSFNPDLILLDLFMPGMDGFEVCRQLKDDSQTLDIPVAMFTAVARRHEQEKGMALGAVAYLTKPFFPRELLSRIALLLQEHPRGGDE